MLAYLFFHRPNVDVDVRLYEDGLRRFHAALAAAPPDGFVSSQTYRVTDRYCDWYLVETSSALDVLNDAAVSGARLPLHDSVAHRARDGTGKLLKLTAGTHDPAAGFELWFSKPQGTSYADLYERLRPWTEQPRASLWRRMMVLGPPPEFCLLTYSEQRLPGDLSPELVPREPV